MIVTVNIEPINKEIREQSLPCSYQFEGRMRMLLDDDSVLDTDINPSKDKPRQPERMLPPSIRGSSVLTYKYESDVTKQNNFDKKKEYAVKVFWGQHPMVTVNGAMTKFTKAPAFDIVNFTDKSINLIKKWRDKLDVANTVNQMSYEEKVNLFYYYGENPKGKTENDLILTLVNFENGICLSDDEVVNFKNIFIKNDNSDKDIIINIRKALSWNVIEEKTIDGRSSFYLGETFLGTAFNDIIAFCKREEKIYQDYLIRQVESKEDLKAEKKESTPTTPTIDLQALDALKIEAAKLKSEGHIWKGLNLETSTFETLTNHVKEGRVKRDTKNSKVISEL